MPIEWQSGLATGIDAIDKQHREIFARFAVFSTACNESSAKEELASLALFLEDYTISHFKDEEKAMRETDYADLSTQQNAHAIFAGNISELKKKINENEPDMPEILEMKRLLIRWLIQHIKQQDMAFADFLKGAASKG